MYAGNIVQKSQRHDEDRLSGVVLPWYKPYNKVVWRSLYISLTGEDRALKKNNFTLFLFVFLGLLAGTVAGQLLSPVSWLSFLLQSVEISWQPKADLQVIRYDLDILIRVNVVSLLGIVAAVWLYRKL